MAEEPLLERLFGGLKAKNRCQSGSWGMALIDFG